MADVPNSDSSANDDGTTQADSASDSSPAAAGSRKGKGNRIRWFVYAIVAIFVGILVFARVAPEKAAAWSKMLPEAWQEKLDPDYAPIQLYDVAPQPDPGAAGGE